MGPASLWVLYRNPAHIGFAADLQLVGVLADHSSDELRETPLLSVRQLPISLDLSFGQPNVRHD